MDQLERLIVKGCSAAADYIPLTPLDIYLGHYITGGAYFFLRPPNIERLKTALTIALDRHPTFDACMVREAQGIGLSCGTTGAELLIHHSDMHSPNLRSTESLITTALLANTPASDNEVPGYSFNSGRPVASFQLTLFNDGPCALLIRHVHSQADGAGAVHFLQNWSRAYRGLSLSSASGYSRAHIAGLATMPGLAPTRKLNIRQYGDTQTWVAESHREAGAQQHHATRSDEPPDNPAIARDGASIRMDVPGPALDNFVHGCRRSSRLSLTSSEVLHALAWQCFAKACHARASVVPRQEPPPTQLPQCVHNVELTSGDAGLQARPVPSDDATSIITATTRPNIHLYTLFDLRNIKSLGIPYDYDGSAVLGRCAELDAADVRSLAIPELALAIQRQLKPFTAEEAHADISYLAREYDQGHIDENGNYANFVIGAWLECRSASGLIVNDLRRLVAADLCFEEQPARMETLVSEEINMVSIYQNDDGTVTLHYVGERHTLPIFAECLNDTMTAVG